MTSIKQYLLTFICISSLKCVGTLFLDFSTLFKAQIWPFKIGDRIYEYDGKKAHLRSKQEFDATIAKKKEKDPLGTIHILRQHQRGWGGQMVILADQGGSGDCVFK